MKSKIRKKYSPPRLKIIELETREVMANVCKAGGAEMNIGLPMCGMAVPCAEQGS